VQELEKLITQLRKFTTLRVSNCREIVGEVSISGAKNSALPLLAASLLVEELILENFPILLDTLYGLKILQNLGKEIVLFPKSNKVIIRGKLKENKVNNHLASLFRGSILFLGGLLGSVGKAQIAQPGGCPIGKRPIDLHLKFLQSVGCQIEQVGAFITVKLPKKPKRREFSFEKITVTGTENALLTLTALEGEFILKNVALEPEVLDLVSFLRKLGIRIETSGRTFKIFVPSKGKLKTKEVHRIIPDRIEAGTFLVLGALLGEPLKVKNLNVNHLGAVIEKLQETGVNLKIVSPSEVIVYKSSLTGNNYLETQPYPGFPTDMQAQFMVLYALAKGKSVVVENIFENRFQHAVELRKMGAKIKVEGNKAFIEGVNKLMGTSVRATDLRASAALVIAGTVAEGETTISNIYHLLRGYENFQQKLSNLGCSLELL
jgi:UDP-N-acetylglucosamine 1-carboxyvinyltransferase